MSCEATKTQIVLRDEGVQWLKHLRYLDTFFFISLIPDLGLMKVFGNLVGETETTRNGQTKYTKHVLSHNQLSGGFVWVLCSLFIFSLFLSWSCFTDLRSRDHIVKFPFVFFSDVEQ